MTARIRSMHLGIGPGIARSPEDDAESVPYQDLGDALKEAIEDAIKEAWDRLPDVARTQGISLIDAAETTITRLLQDELEKIRRDSKRSKRRFNDSVFCAVSEGDGIPDQTGMPFDDNTKHPDLIIRPQVLPPGVIRARTYGLFIECKIIEHSRDDHGISHYCTNGLIRFVDGRYACVMPSGMMVAYVRKDATVARHLTRYLQKRRHDYEVMSLPQIHPRRNAHTTPSIFISSHGRSRVQVGSRKRSPGPIEITHLWLDVVCPEVVDREAVEARELPRQAQKSFDFVVERNHKPISETSGSRRRKRI